MLLDMQALLSTAFVTEMLDCRLEVCHVFPFGSLANYKHNQTKSKDIKP